MLAFQNQAPARFEVSGLASRFEAVATASAKFDLSVSLSEERATDGSPLGISGGIEYASDLFERSSVEALAGRFIRMLEGAVAAPDRALGGVDLLSREERATILRGWNATAHALLPATLPALFAAQAARCPDAVAVVFEEERLCYGELDRRANQLAHHLRALGVGPETVVGLCLARSLDLLVGLLGILKAGGAYLPLDPDYPRERLAFMLADAGARVLITHGATQAAIEEDASWCAAGAAKHRAAPGAARCRRGGDCGASHERPCGRPRPAQRRLRHLHLRLHRHAQGRRGRAWQRCRTCCWRMRADSRSSEMTEFSAFDFIWVRFAAFEHFRFRLSWRHPSCIVAMRHRESSSGLGPNDARRFAHHPSVPPAIAVACACDKSQRRRCRESRWRQRWRGDLIEQHRIDALTPSSASAQSIRSD